MTPPAHHTADGRFRNPWPESAGDEELRSRFREVLREWIRRRNPEPPPAGSLPQVEPAFLTSESVGEVRVTWVGHATFLIQFSSFTVLTDPVWSTRVSPVSFVGARRFVPPVPDFDKLPQIDAVLISHDHYDHLDLPTVRRLYRRYGDALTWFTPLGYRPWFEKAGIRNVVERDWWEEVIVDRWGASFTAAPARHWCRRSPWDTNRRLWCSWAIRLDGAVSVFFAGDSGYGSFYGEIGNRLGPFDASLLPIGAYDPRWFMAAAHMDPAEAVRAFRDLGGKGTFIPMHWGTFRLTLEDPLEPPALLAKAWEEAGLAGGILARARHGETTTVRAAGEPTSFPDLPPSE